MTRPRTIVVVRHGKSSWKTNDPDLRRPLSPRGTRDAVVAGQQLAPLGVDVVLVSPATRAQQTWQCLQMGGVSCDDVRTTDALYHAWTPEVVEVVRSLPDAAHTVFVIGHEPTLSHLIGTLAAPSPLMDDIEAKFPTSAIAVLTHDDDWSGVDEGACRLQAFEVPRG
ncbi:MAG TPA: histidine phosphatase family protein [Propionibacterium sp.]|nr:histidine phosphatase family protein [Propionibacterium sp.]